MPHEIYFTDKADTSPSIKRLFSVKFFDVKRFSFKLFLSYFIHQYFFNQYFHETNVLLFAFDEA